MYENGKVCISILHPPGEDAFNELVSSILYLTLSSSTIFQETSAERWRPILGVESIIISVMSMLSDPNDESPANIDAAVSGSYSRSSTHATTNQHNESNFNNRSLIISTFCSGDVAQ